MFRSKINNGRIFKILKLMWLFYDFQKPASIYVCEMYYYIIAMNLNLLPISTFPSFSLLYNEYPFKRE